VRALVNGWTLLPGTAGRTTPMDGWHTGTTTDLVVEMELETTSYPSRQITALFTVQQLNIENVLDRGFRFLFSIDCQALEN
jgi:hypothetical protein